MRFAAMLRQSIEQCCEGDPIPGWCIRTGNCQCDMARKLLKRIERKPDAASLAHAAYNLGKRS